ncbi:MAG TPA: glycosyltransferase family 2 protein [Candidatus Limnocylindrales bacterium]|nr:glycosyltransferase family 2 protein [Candidatus Limnocylindrales bacterium]
MSLNLENYTKKPSLSLIFPAYNEELNIEQVVKSALIVAPKVAEKYEIIVVNDGSRDRTGEVINKLAGLHPPVVAIHHPINQGYGAALKSGIKRAQSQFIFFCDSDCQFDLFELPLLLNWIDHYDMVIGYRQSRKDPIHRLINAWGWNMLVRLLLGLKVRDIDCAFKLFRREIFDRIEINSVGAMVNTEILSRAVKLGFTIKEVPVTHYPRFRGRQTGARLRVIVKAFKELIRLHKELRLY